MSSSCNIKLGSFAFQFYITSMNSNKNTIRPFHLAFPVNNIQKAKSWYTKILGCTIGRESDTWVDFNFFGHQIVAHLSNNINPGYINYNKVDSHKIPSRHFGIILSMKNWKLLAKRLEDLDIDFIIKPYIRFKGGKGEQATLFIKDPSENYIEFKAFLNDEMIFDH